MIILSISKNFNIVAVRLLFVQITKMNFPLTPYKKQKQLISQFWEISKRNPQNLAERRGRINFSKRLNFHIPSRYIHHCHNVTPSQMLQSLPYWRATSFEDNINLLKKSLVNLFRRAIKIPWINLEIKKKFGEPLS